MAEGQAAPPAPEARTQAVAECGREVALEGVELLRPGCRSSKKREVAGADGAVGSGVGKGRCSRRGPAGGGGRLREL